MISKKCTVQDATLFPRFSILLYVLVLSGCVHRPALPEGRFLKAHSLVDDGTHLLRRREFPEARKAFELASELAPVAAAVDGQGCVALFEGRYADAERLFREAYTMDRHYDEALVHLGFLQELQGYPEEARVMYQEYLRNYPDSPAGRNHLAALEYDQGKGKMSTIEALEKAITLSDQAVIRDNLAVLNGN